MSVNILEDSDSTGEQEVKLVLDNLSKVLCQPELENTHLAIVGIAGPFNTGKSFLLSYILRYLRNNGWNNHEWIGDDNKCADDGIEWRNGIDAHTKGIHIWNDIFYLPTNDDERLAVLFLDTQGLFDRTMDEEGNTKLFTFTMLLCSNLILNIKDRIDERDLKSLEFFTEYAKSVTTELDNQSPFQRLIFLMRDWQHPSNYAYGLSGGSDYLSDVLLPVRSEQNTSVRENLQKTFEQLGCFLLPYPGDCVKEKDFKGRNGDLKPEFLNNVRALVTTIFRLDRLQAKSYGGKLMTGRSMWKLLQVCNDTFVSGVLPKVENMTTAFAKMNCNTAMENALNIFKEWLEKQNESRSMNQDLHGVYEISIKYALELFESEARFGPEDVKRKYREQLISECQVIYETCVQFDELRKITARIYSSDKVHEIWSRYMNTMKKLIDEKHRSDKDLNEMHKMQLKTALRSYQDETLTEVAFHEEHLQHLEKELLGRSFQKLKRINDERGYLENIGSVDSDEVRLVYEEALFLHEISQQYREELEKFAAKYVEETGFEEEMTKMKAKYFEIFQTYSSKGADIVDKFLQTLAEEYEEALTMNKRNKELFENRLKESGMRVKANYRKIMYGLIERDYVDPGILQNEHEHTSERLLGHLNNEWDEIENELKNRVIAQVQQDIDIMYENVRELNDEQKGNKPSVDDHTTKVSTLGETLLDASITTLSIIRGFRVKMGIAKKVYVAGKMFVSTVATVLPSKAGALAALPSAGTVAVAAVAVVGVTLVAYGVYRYCNRKDMEPTEQ